MKNLRRLTKMLAAVALVAAVMAIAARASASCKTWPGAGPVQCREARAIGAIRTLISAEHAYAEYNGGWYDYTWCLTEPEACIPNYPATGAAFFLEPWVGAAGFPWYQLGVRREEDPSRWAAYNGYFFRFIPGPQPDPLDTTISSASSLQSWVFAAWPVIQGQTGVRSFAGDSTGRICVWSGPGEFPYPDIPAPPIIDGVLDSRGCWPL